jgi:PelA/Pel-15E family pectate lyase
VKKHWRTVILLSLVSFVAGCRAVPGVDGPLRAQAEATMKTAATYYRTRIASHGGYVYYYSLDLRERWGEGRARPDTIWVQPPGTPTVGMAYLKAYEATGDTFYLDAARDAAYALVYGQLETGGWSNRVSFRLPSWREIADAVNGVEHELPVSSLDDGQTQSAIQFLARADEALGFKDAKIHDSVLWALDSLLAAQFPNGAFPQGWRAPSGPHPLLKASYPDYDWRTEGRVGEYWQVYTLNDNVLAYVARTLTEAYRIYGDREYLAALRRLGDFLILAQMPDPQPAWAQQYSFEMKPVWARRFEPPAITGWESQGALETLMNIHYVTSDPKYLEPVPRALDYLKRSRLPDGTVARYYELRTNTPLYMVRQEIPETRRRPYVLTYEDVDLPGHYMWKAPERLEQIEARYKQLVRNPRPKPEKPSLATLRNEVRRIHAEMDGEGRWISVHDGQRIVGQPNFAVGYRFINSAVFSRNLETLSEYLEATRRNLNRG